MGNSGACMRAKKNERALRVMKPDGKVLEFRSPVLVEDLLASHPGFYVGAFREATQPLPPNYRLRVGRVYYLLPKLDDRTRRVKVVVTRQQLQRLLTRQMGLDGVMLEAPKRSCWVDDPSVSPVHQEMDPTPEKFKSS